MFWPSQSTLLAGLTPAARRHAAFAVQRVSRNLGIGLGGLTGGLIATTTDRRASRCSSSWTPSPSSPSSRRSSSCRSRGRPSRGGDRRAGRLPRRPPPPRLRRVRRAERPLRRGGLRAVRAPARLREERGRRLGEGDRRRVPREHARDRPRAAAGREGARGPAADARARGDDVHLGGRVARRPRERRVPRGGRRGGALRLRRRGLRVGECLQGPTQGALVSDFAPDRCAAALVATSWQLGFVVGRRSAARADLARCALAAPLAASPLAPARALGASARPR